MKNYRVDYINGKTGRRNHKDYVTQRGAMKFVNYLGRENCVLKSIMREPVHLILFLIMKKGESKMGIKFKLKKS